MKSDGNPYTGWKHPRPKEPVQCAACHRIIRPDQIILRHHISYYPEKLVNVHSSCHRLIHVPKPKYPELVPDRKQLLRWFRKKGYHYATHPVYADGWYFRMFIDAIENGFMTIERKEREFKEMVKRYQDNEAIEDCRRKEQEWLNPKKFLITLDWQS